MSFLSDIFGGENDLLTGSTPPQNPNLSATVGKPGVAEAPKKALEKSWLDHLQDPVTIAMLAQTMASGASRTGGGVAAGLGAITDGLNAGSRASAAIEKQKTDEEDRLIAQEERDRKRKAQDRQLAQTDRQLDQGDRRLDITEKRNKALNAKAYRSALAKKNKITSAMVKAEMKSVADYNKSVLESQNALPGTEQDTTQLLPVLSPQATARKLQLEKQALANGMPQQLWDSINLYTPLDKDVYAMNLEITRAYVQGKEIGDAFIQQLNPPQADTPVGAVDEAAPVSAGPAGATVRQGDAPSVPAPAPLQPGPSALGPGSGMQAIMQNPAAREAVSNLKNIFLRTGKVSMEQYQEVMNATGLELKDLVFAVERK